jgi:hypothetical protein
MAHLIENDFTSYELTPEEMLQGSILTITQRQCIQNQISVIAMEKIALELDTNNPIAFAQQEAYKKGGLEVLKHLKDLSEAAVEELTYQEDNPEA